MVRAIIITGFADNVVAGIDWAEFNNEWSATMYARSSVMWAERNGMTEFLGNMWTGGVGDNYVWMEVIICDADTGNEYEFIP